MKHISHISGHQLVRDRCVGLLYLRHDLRCAGLVCMERQCLGGESEGG